MARGDFRYTPRYQFWAAIIALVTCGAALGWFLSRNQFDDTLGLLPGGLIGLAVVLWLNRRGSLSHARNSAEPYDHPVLGLYFGLPATITLLLLDESWRYAVLVGLVMGLVLAVAAVALRRWRTRNDRPNRHRPIPILTGWR